jgi:hypothetical protein
MPSESFQTAGFPIYALDLIEADISHILLNGQEGELSVDAGIFISASDADMSDRIPVWRRLKKEMMRPSTN